MRFVRGWSPWHLRRALRLIRVDKPNGCENIVGSHAPCRTEERRSADCSYLADRWCDSCIAEAAINGEPIPEGSEVAG